MSLFNNARFNPNVCDDQNQNHTLDLDTLSSKIEDKVNDYLSEFDLTATVTVTDKVQKFFGYLYRFDFTINDETYHNAKFVKCIDDPVTVIYDKIIHRMNKLGIINNTGTLQLTDTESADYTITDVTPTDEGYLVTMDVTYNDNTYKVTYVTNDVSKISYDVKEAVMTALVNNLAITDFDVIVGYTYVEG